MIPPNVAGRPVEDQALPPAADGLLDAALGCATLRQTATLLFGGRATRHVIRTLGQSMASSGSLLPVSLAVAVDDPAGSAALAADDIAAILDAGCRSPLTSRRPLQPKSRKVLSAVLTGFTRQRRRDVACTVLTDTVGQGEQFLRQIDDLAAAARRPPDPAPRPADLPALNAHLRHSLAWCTPPPDWTSQLPAAQDFVGNEIILLPGQRELRIPSNQQQFTAEGQAFSNCLGSHYREVRWSGTLIVTLRVRGIPVAAAELEPSGTILEISAPANGPLTPERQRQLKVALTEAGFVRPHRDPDPDTWDTTERLGARIACRTAVLLADDLDPTIDENWSSGAQYGDETMRILGERAVMLTDVEHAQIRRTVQRPSDAETIDAWSTIGVMLIAAGMRTDDDMLTRLDRSAPFRLAVRTHARQVLLHHLAPNCRPLDPQQLMLLDLQRQPAWVRTGVQEAIHQTCR